MEMVIMPFRLKDLQNKKIDFRTLCFICCGMKVENGSIASVKYRELPFEDYSLKDNSTFKKRLNEMLKVDDRVLDYYAKENIFNITVDYSNSDVILLRVPKSTLKNLIINYDSNTVKTYLYLSYILKYGPKIITQSEICKQVGINSPTTIREKLRVLVDEGLIKREKVQVEKTVDRNNIIPSNYKTLEYKYELV